ncbi:hypothetical protein [Flavobacterium noncentrifugens]|uniref:Uncharacterized protein n=1 Tax=Flavobacterium noncentrifugens TaxID=1128970 RepID=A0A1G8Y2G2_9FLAO|nr:hypothetical protein [Flavobacterium noncentrifugens]SDJ96634.1 hypothetical protein SAMN04487935_2153 [Flavobacterium noncentrifugens]
MQNNQIIFAVAILIGISPIIMELIIFRKFRLFTLFNHFSIGSMPLRDLAILAISNEDRTTYIKDFFDFRYQNISSIIKGISAVIVVNVGVFLEVLYGKDGNFTFWNHWPLIASILALSLCNLWYFNKLKLCVKDFRKAIILYEIIK